MKKTAAIILNHNIPEYTDLIHNWLKPYEKNDYDLIVLDNGSTQDGKSKYTSRQIEENVYFGGGFNYAMNLVNSNEQYDSLLFINNDIKLHPYNFVKTLRNNMFDSNGNILFDIVSPSVFHSDMSVESFWKTMHSWGSSAIREVPYIDFQCPLISKRLLTEVGSIDKDLQYGWGIDAWLALICEEKKFKLGVLDSVSIVHFGSATTKKNRLKDIDFNEYMSIARRGSENFFSKIKKTNEYDKLMHRAAHYNF